MYTHKYRKLRDVTREKNGERDKIWDQEIPGTVCKIEKGQGLLYSTVKYREFVIILNGV